MGTLRFAHPTQDVVELAFKLITFYLLPTEQSIEQPRRP